MTFENTFGSDPTAQSKELETIDRGEQVLALIRSYYLDTTLSPERRDELAEILMSTEGVQAAVLRAEEFGINFDVLPDRWQTAITVGVEAQGIRSYDEYQAWSNWIMTVKGTASAAQEAVGYNVLSPTEAEPDVSMEAWRKSDYYKAFEKGVDPNLYTARRSTAEIVKNAEARGARVTAGSQLAPGEVDYSDAAPLISSPAYHRTTVGADDYNPWGYVSIPRTEVVSDIANFMRHTGEGMDPNSIRSQEYWASQAEYTPFFTGDGMYDWASRSPEQRARLEKQMEAAGVIDPLGYNPGEMSMIQGDAWETVLTYAYARGYGPEFALVEMQRNKEAYDRSAAAAAARGGSSYRPTFSVPASLREIPDYKSIEQETTNLFRRILGRDVEDYELGILADSMQARYQEANKERIDAARAAFNASLSGQQGLMEVEVPDPVLRTQKFIESRYGSEIDRYEQIEDSAATNQLLIGAITRGTSMVM